MNSYPVYILITMFHWVKIIKEIAPFNLLKENYLHKQLENLYLRPKINKKISSKSNFN
jgi:hypothetical protein